MNTICINRFKWVFHLFFTTDGSRHVANSFLCRHFKFSVSHFWMQFQRPLWTWCLILHPLVCPITLFLVPSLSLNKCIRAEIFSISMKRLSLGKCEKGRDVHSLLFPHAKKLFNSIQIFSSLGCTTRISQWFYCWNSTGEASFTWRNSWMYITTT